MAYTQKQLRRFFQELGFDPNLLGYEILLKAFEVVLENPGVLYGETLNLMYDSVIESFPNLTRNKVRKNAEHMINKWWDNEKITHPMKDRIQRINYGTQMGIHVMLSYMRDELLSREEE